MKAEINKIGQLQIRSESELEEYALQQWFDNYNQGNNKSTLLITVTDNFLRDLEKKRDEWKETHAQE